MRLLCAAVIGLSGAAGCVLRRETITVGRDGAVTMELEYEGKPDELSGGDAMPSEKSGWSVTRSTKKEGDEVREVLASTRRFGPREELPRSFAPPGDALERLALSFPTAVRMEPRADGTYYYFQRTYTPRRWGYIQYFREAFFDEQVNKLAEEDPQKLTPEQRQQLVGAFTMLEAFKQLEFAREALAECEPTLPMERFLVARQRLLDYYDEQSDAFEADATACAALPEEQQSECYNQAAERILKGGYDTLMASLKEHARLDGPRSERFAAAYRRAETYFKITDSLGTHAFEIQVNMPGEIVAHNGEKAETDAQAGTSQATFKFDGRAFRDRTQELIVVSRVTDGSRR
jgi:hypothetical protein